MDSEDSKVAKLEQALAIRPVRPEKTRISSEFKKNDSKYVRYIQEGVISSDEIDKHKETTVRRYTNDEIIDIKRSGKKGCHSIISDGVHFKIPINPLGLDELEKNNNFEEELDSYELGHYSSCFDWSEASRQSRRGKTLESLLESDTDSMGTAKVFVDFIGNFIFESLDKILPTEEAFIAIDHIVFNRERVKQFSKRKYEMYGEDFERTVDAFTDEIITSTRKDAPVCMYLSDAKLNNFIVYDRNFGEQPHEKIGLNDQGLRRETLSNIMKELDMPVKDKTVRAYRHKATLGQPFFWLGYLSEDIADNENIAAGVKEYLINTFEHFTNTGEYIFSNDSKKTFPSHEWYSKSARLQYKFGKIYYNTIKATNPAGASSSEEATTAADIHYMKELLV